ncbi:response regulator transcription factor [Gordonia sp. CPCC 205333]|uniref:response regulator transcription factor n=1 Tax=Gordonia sp. CPCC 205333 TaxID=3140790 RepID=UPI003AF349BF
MKLAGAGRRMFAVRILLVEDDSDVAEELSTALRRQGGIVSRVSDGQSAIRAHGDVDLILLDLGLPDLDGLEVCRRIRRVSTVPIIVVSAKVEEMDRVLALKSGADDFVSKPYGFWELTARIESLMRRAGTASTPPVESNSAERLIEVGPITVDQRQRRVRVDGAEVDLTRMEFDLLVALLTDPGAVFDRDQLGRVVWGSDWVGSSRALDVHVNALRRKLGNASYIETIRGVGFRVKVSD